MKYANDNYGLHGNISTTIALASIVLLILLIAGIKYTTFSVAMIPFRIRYVNTRKVLGESVASLRMGMIADAVQNRPSCTPICLA